MSEANEIRLRKETIDALNEVLSEVVTRDSYHAAGYPATRDGVRLGLADAQDKLSEAIEAWHVYKLTSNWHPARSDLVQLAAIAVRILREIKP